MSRIEHIGDATLYLGDCLEILPTLGNVDAVVTSPPYAQQREYGQPVDNWRQLVSGAMLAANYSEDAQVLVNLGLVFRNGECLEYWDDLKIDMRAASWRLFGWYVWDKGYGIPAGDMNRPPTAHEWVFHFNKKSRHPHKWVRTKDRMDLGRSLRQANGTVKQFTSLDKIGQPFKVPDSVVRLPPNQVRGGPESEHPATFPVPFAHHFVRTFTSEHHTVCDPFMGSGTTGVACANLGRKFIGIEIEPKYFEIACKRIAAAYAQPRLFAEPQAKPVQTSLLGPA